MKIDWGMVAAVAIGFTLAMLAAKFVLPKIGVAMFDDEI